MNKAFAKVVDIKKSGDLCHLFLTTSSLNLGLVMLTNHFEVGDEITIGFKETAVAISKEKTSSLSYSNQILVSIESITQGEILTKVVGKSIKEELELTSVITANSAKRLELKVGDEVTFLVKATDMFVM